MVYILLGAGFEEMEAVIPCDLLRRAGIPTAYVGIGGREMVGSHGIAVTADMTVEQMDLTQLDMIVLPGGKVGVESISQCPEALEAVRFSYENEKFVAAICAAPTILAALHITDGRRVTCYPAPRWTEQMHEAVLCQDGAVRDGRVITGASAGCATAFALELVAALRGREAAEAVAREIVIR